MDWFVVALVLAIILGGWVALDWFLDAADQEYDEYHDWFDDERKWKQEDDVMDKEALKEAWLCF